MCAMISTRTVTINAAFLEEIKEVHEHLWETLGRLQDLYATPTASESYLRQLTRLLAELRDQLALHFSLEEAYGYFDDPIEVAPHICLTAERLRGEHQDLYLRICDLVDQAEQASDLKRQAAVVMLVSGCCEFHERLTRHEQAETELIQEAYAADIGVGD